jgi:predicted nucleic acid-binding protein
MRRVFADAGYWIALLNPKDSLHVKAREISATLGRVRTVTSEMVLTEVLNAFASKGEPLRNAACALVDRVRSSVNAEVVPMTSSAFRDATQRYRGGTDKTWGLTDCTSFLIMEQKGITDALSADRDFQQAGFNIRSLDNVAALQTRVHSSR